MQFEYDPERLIEEVKKRPGIWDFENADYRAKNVRHQLWTDVVNELMGPDVKVTKSEMRELELQLQKKWKSIRDCFHKYVSNPNKTKRPYIYARQLTFLLKPDQIADNEEPGSSDSDAGYKLLKKRVWKPKKKIRISKEVESSEDEVVSFVNQDDFVSNYSDNDLEVPAKKSSRTPKQPINDFVFASVDSQSRSDDDPDKLFLLSLVPHLKSIPEELRLSVKMQLLQVLQNATYNSSREPVL